jgi:hypothetical protein
MSSDKGTHVDMVIDASIVKSNNLQSNDIFKSIETVDRWRMSRDLIFRLLVNEDEEELVEHVLGIIAAPATTKTPSLLEQSYNSGLTARTQQVFWRLQNYKDLPEFKDNCHRRVQLHFVLFTTMALENEFCQYVVHHCAERDKLRMFINECVKPSLSKLLRGEMLSTQPKSNSCTAFGVSEFVSHCRFAYIRVITFPSTTCCVVETVTVIIALLECRNILRRIFAVFLY